MSKLGKIGLGCLASSVVMTLLLLVIIWKVAVPKMAPIADAYLVAIVNTAIVDYSLKHFEQLPENGDNAYWTGILADYELEGIKLKWFIKDGRLHSVMRVPLDIETNEAGQVRVVAAGADREFGTVDDIDVDTAHATLERHMNERSR